jgi:hypothetical protein
MIEELPEGSGEVLGFRLSGTFTANDLTGVLIPALERASETYGIIRLVIGVTDFKGETLGAMIEDYRHRVRFPHIEREAIIGGEDISG